MPKCKRCGEQHYNFVPCAAVETFKADQAEKQRRLNNLNRPVLRPRENDWANRYNRGDYQQLGNNNIMVIRGRKAEHPLKSPTYVKPPEYRVVGE